MNENKNRIIANVRANNASKSESAHISLIAMATGMTILDTCRYLLETEGPNAEVERLLAVMNKFYGLS